MKSLVVNQLGDDTVRHYLPMTGVNAVTFATDIFAGTWKVFEETSSLGSDTAVVNANKVGVQLVDSVGHKTYLRMIAKSTMSSDDIRTALTGLTINGVLVDKVVFVDFSPLTFA
ncbi:hypothetical protein Sulku_1342 [Sulfuricurvum kujiense DSM 16994]|uniref:Uncharacterized protein n=1 Tax=Sulfuricurvum kujiense (strain ATCC BAA-921 / DSM 16994 / JCM 11577 / YK-1) TaxID=709032 RepID=E4TY85_SULKY|nr:hypothetical protein [Sulfuricurvum kujiense]ADR34005.1 hypothetical protein Sulku_1342 [Sulfuricurvum kujiense DSM 16994]